jgi:peptide/nickel transport system permease protein
MSLTGYILKRLLQMLPTLLGVMLMIFVLFNCVGGDPAYILAGKVSDPATIASIRKQLGIDQSYLVQFWIFIKQVFTFDFGRSWSTNELVSQILVTRIGPTLTLLIPCVVLETFIAVICAMLVVAVRGTLIDRSVMIVSTVVMSISFLVYIVVFQWLFGYKLGWFPIQGWTGSVVTNLRVYAPLPVMLAVFVSVAPSLRLYRSFILDEINHDYVRTARAKGLSERTVMFRHVLRNAAIPIVTNVTTGLPAMLVGLFLLEFFFSIPGLGREMVVAVNNSDFPIVKAVTVYLAMLTMVVNLAVDLMYRWLDPRVSFK